MLTLGAEGLTSGPLAGSRPPDPSEILRRAEAVRSPDLEYAVDFTIALVDNYAPGVERKAAYSMVASGKDHTMVLMLTPESFYGGTMMIRDGAYWLLLPRATRSFQLSAEQVFQGDIGNGDLARANFLTDYVPRLDGEEKVEGDLCWRLELVPRTGNRHYSRVVAWVAHKKFLPRKFEFYGLTGTRLKTAVYTDYRRTPLGLRSMRLEVDNPSQMQRKTTMVFSDLRKIDASPIAFTPEGMTAFRDAALAKLKADGGQARPEDILARLAAGKR